MKKRIVIIMLSMFLVLGLAGCGNSIVKDATKQREEAMQKKEYNKALASFDIVLDNDAENEEVGILKNITKDYLTAKEYLAQGKVQEAQKTINGINSKYSEYSIKEDVVSLKKQIDERIDAELKKIEEEKKVEKANNKQAYMKKLDDIQLGLKDLSELYAGSTLEMKKASNEEYKRWDSALNDIYNVLKTQLSESDMSKLKEKQIQWIANKEKKAKEESLEFKGGTMEGLIYSNSLAETTKERCYELVKEYMK